MDNPSNNPIIEQERIDRVIDMVGKLQNYAKEKGTTLEAVLKQRGIMSYIPAIDDIKGETLTNLESELQIIFKLLSQGVKY